MNVKFDWHQKRKWRPGWKWINRNVKQSALKSFCAVAKTLESSVGRVSRLIGHLIGRFFGPLHGPPKKEKIIFLCFNQALVTRVPPGGLGLNFSARKSPRWDLEWADWILFFFCRVTRNYFNENVAGEVGGVRMWSIESSEPLAIFSLCAGNFFVGSSCAKGRRWRTAGRVSNQASTSRAQPLSAEARPLDSLLDADAAADIFISFFHFLWLLLLDYFIDQFNEQIKSIRLPNPNVNEPTNSCPR